MDPDDRAIGEAAAAHFLECGFRNVALIADQFPFGSGGLVINNTGAGGVSMFGANAFTGGVTLNAGTLTIGAAGALGTAAHVLTVNGGNLRTVIGATVANGLTTVSDPLAPSDAGQYTAIVPFAAGNNLAANVNAATRVTYDPVTGIGYISPVDATKVYQATLRVSSDANLGSLAAPVNFQGTGGTLQFAASSTFAKPIVFAGGGGGNLDTGANIVTLASPLSGVTVAGFNKLGSGSLTLAASSPLFAGRVAVNAGSDGFEAAPLSPFECASAGLGNDLESFTPRSSQATCSAWRL